MNLVDARRYEMLTRVSAFGAAHTDLFPKTSPGGQAFATIAAAVEALSGHDASQWSARSATREGLTTKAVARDALRDALDDISRTARALAVATPGLEDKFRLPRSNSDRLMLTAARGFLQDAKPLEKEFVTHYLPKTFLSDLEQHIDEFEEATRDHQRGKEIDVAARAAIEAQLEAALTAVRQLDAMVPNRIGDDPMLLATWQQARKIEYRNGRARPEPPAPPAQTGQPAADASSSSRAAT